MPKTERSSARTQFVIFTLFGDFIRARGGSIWTSGLLSLLRKLGVGERAARNTLSRMSRRGWLVALKEGRRSQYSLTPRGWALLLQGEKRIFEPPLKEWDGMWHMVVVSLPEEKRRLRRVFRIRLTWLGFAPLTPNTWISPRDRRAGVFAICNELDIQDHVELFLAIHLGPSQDQNLVKQCWDLPKLKSKYQEFLKQFEEDYEKFKSNGKEPLAPDFCFVQRFWLTYRFQNFPREDPNLPAALLPSDWIGFQARQLFDDYHHLLEENANKFVDEVVGTASSR